MDSLNNTTPEKRAAMAHIINLMSVAVNDGKVTQEEQQLIKTIANEYGLTNEELDYCADTCNQCAKDGTVVIEPPKSDSEKALMIKNMVMTMMTDGEISESERQLVEFYAERFGFKAKESVDSLIDAIIDEFGRQPDELETGEAVKRGKEALLENYVVAAFDHLYYAAHVDQTARRLFLMIPEINSRLFLLTMDQEEFLEEEAKKGDSLAQYTLARLYQAQGHSFDEARDLFIAAAKSGMGDPIASLAVMMVNGQLTGMEVDKEKYYEGIGEAAEKNSMLGQYYLYRAAIRGSENYPANPKGVIDNIKDWLKGDESEDILKVNPTYYEILAMAYEDLGDMKTAADYYLKCVRMGRHDLHYRWTLNAFLNENMEIIDDEGYVKAVEDGIAMGCPGSHLLRAFRNEYRYDTSNDPREKAELSKKIDHDYFMAGNLGDGYGCYWSGHHQHYGSYGITKDPSTAWMRLLEASGMNVPEAWEEMGKMYLEEEAPKDLGPNFISYCRLMGLRQGDDNMLIPVIISFMGGYLDDYRNEVKKYYLPRYDALSDEEKTQYFGIEFVAIIDASGSARLTEFDFTLQDWAELEELIDATSLVALHTKQLDEIGEKLDLEGRLTAWADSDRRGKSHESYVITLEDDASQPTTIELGTLKKIVEAIGAHVDDVYYEEFPDNDSQYDPYA